MQILPPTPLRRTPLSTILRETTPERRVSTHETNLEKRDGVSAGSDAGVRPGGLRRQLTVCPGSARLFHRREHRILRDQKHVGNSDVIRCGRTLNSRSRSGGGGSRSNGETGPGRYSTKEEVALYLHLYGHLPDNFISKKAAHALGWSGGSLEPYAPGCSIGGSRFSNYEGLLPEKNGRIYQECDIDTMGAKKRGAKRIVWSNDGLIYYTDDHYESFTLLYGEE